jgi:acyl-CoA thioester hydrolase
MKVFEHSLKVHPEDIDEMDHINNVVYVRWVQEVAAAHWNHHAPLSLKEKYAWVVLRHEIDYKNPGYLMDKISGTTWVGDHNGARFDRYVKITAGTRILAEAKTTWCLLDAKKLRPTRIPEEIIVLL